MAGDDDTKNVHIRLRDRNQRIQMAEAYWQGQSACYTEASEAFVVNHYDRPDPVGREQASVAVVGPDGRTSELTYDEIKAIPSVGFAAVIECAGMSRGFLTERAPGQQFGHGMAANAVWTGARIRDVLDAAGVQGQFDALVVRGPDEGLTEPEREHSDYSKGLPRLKALHPDTLLGWEMNGAPLPHIHGGPLRMVVPGWYGTWWVKWVTRLELIRGTYDGFWQTTRYSYQGSEFPGNTPVTAVLPRAIIVDPVDGAELHGSHVEVRGYAWAGEKAVDRVDVSTDGGREWQLCTLARPCGSYGWVEWSRSVPIQNVEGGVTISARATDVAGRTQGWHAKPNRLGYSNNAIHTVGIGGGQGSGQGDG